MLIINIAKLFNAGVLAERTQQSPSIGFKRFNLIYGFNGSGKSTLSRCFAALQADGTAGRLPSGCEFEFVIDTSATVCVGPSNILSRHIAVFNEDFIEENLQWSAGRAKPVFYIGREQAELAAELAKAEAEIPLANERKTAADRLLRAKEQQLTNFKREHARAISNELRQANRKYEAPQLTADFTNLDLGHDAKLDDEALAAQREVCRLEAPMPQLNEFAFGTEVIASALKAAGQLATHTPSVTIIAELENHPDMLMWVKEGSTYHINHGLDACLLCGGELTAARKQRLERALDEGFQVYVDGLERSKSALESAKQNCLRAAADLPAAKDVSADLRSSYESAVEQLKDGLSDTRETFLEPAIATIDAKLARPTATLASHDLTWHGAGKSRTVPNGLDEAILNINRVIGKHNEATAGFVECQNDARLALRRYHLADKQEEYKGATAGVTSAEDERDKTERALLKLQDQASELRARIKEHGRAAEKINQLIAAYLGHKELSILSVEQGYVIRRRGKPIEGSPSEGEKTAIALCYFLSTLEAEGRSIQDRIVVIDDPISSLDSRALNYACSLILSRLANADQVFVLTHNQNCMNEFKKAWKNLHRPRNEATAPTAALLFLDVKMAKGTGQRSTSIIEMSKLLREYDSEYHYLFDHVLKFDASNDPDYEYAYMMPNVLRRVLDVFLAFRCPGSAGFASKMEQLRKDHTALDTVRVSALERLVQLESHSDNLDDLISFSSMTLEESKAAAAALIGMMDVVDPTHLAGLRRLCR
jgi:wobble nucleotide-excising tRNase